MSTTMPRRLSPRRTRKFLGIRYTPKTGEGITGGLFVSILLVACTDLPVRFANMVAGI